jgi:hypothetical protein
MSTINLDVDGLKFENDNTDKGTFVKSEFLYDMPIHEIAIEFTKLSKENRVLIVPIGFPQAGKSLFISSLMYFAIKGQEPLFRTNIETKFPYDKGNKTIDDMVRFFDKQELYGATRKGSLDLIGINIQPAKNNLPDLKLAFLDLAGEDKQNIQTSKNGAFTEKINAVFQGMQIDNSPIIFTLVTPFAPAKKSNQTETDAHQEEDRLHTEFLNYIAMSQKKILSNAKFFIVVSQWDKNPNEGQSVEDFIRTHRTGVYNYVKNSEVVWGNYSVGQILETNSNGVQKANIVRINYEYPARFWKKLYHICTGKDLDYKPWWRKILG